MHFKIDLKILALEPQPNGLTLIEGLGTDGTSAVVSLRVADPLAVGSWITMALFAEPAATQPAAAAPSMRERVQARAGGLATPGAAPRSANTAATPTAAGEASSLLLSSILGNRGTAAAKQSELPDNSPLVERNVDDEMDALFGAPRKG